MRLITVSIAGLLALGAAAEAAAQLPAPVLQFDDTEQYEAGGKHNGNRLADAIADFNAVIRINPSSHVAYFNGGSVYRKMGEQD